MRQNMHVHYSAEDYDRYTQQHVSEYDDGLIKRILQEHRLMGGGPRMLMDIGTGTAQLLIKFANHPKLKGFKLIGTDYFEDMVEQACETVKRNGLEDAITIHQCDVHAMSYADEFADIVISRSTIHHWADPVKAFQEIFRILKPGGVAVIHEPRRNPNPRALAEFNRRREQAGVEPARLDEKYTAAEVKSFLKQAGLHRHSLVIAPSRGPGAMGFEVRISKVHPIKTFLIAIVGKLFQLKDPWAQSRVAG